MKVKILYATEVGTTKYVAEIIKKRFEDLGHQLDIQQVGSQKVLPTLEGFELLLLGSPTYYNGQPHDDMVRFLTDFKPDLTHIQVAIFALGESGYSHFCGAAEVLEQWVAENQGKLLIPTLKIDGYPSDPSSISTWVKLLVSPE